MDEELNVILRAVDEASDTFQEVTESAEEMGNTMSEEAETAAEEFDTVNESAEDMSNTLTEGTAAASEGFQEVTESAEATAEPMNEIQSIITGFVGVEVFQQLSETLWDLADSAGTYSDSMMRASIEAEGAGISANDMAEAVSDLSRATGRSGSEIRESFIKATARGITNLDSFKSMMEGAGAQATLLGTDIGSMADKYSSFASRSSIMEKALASTGITVKELGEALGIQGATVSDVNKKWKTMTEDQRAAALGQAATMNEGKNANEEYKKSWAGVQEQIDIARGRLERLLGEVILPILIPILKTAGDAINKIGDIISTVTEGPLGGFVSIIGGIGAAVALAIPAIAALSAAMDIFTASLAPAIIASWGLIAPWLPFIAIGAAIIAAVYGIGVAFGWWSDVGSMVESITAGLKRLWAAFINNPDVQAFIQGIKAAWDSVVKALQPVIKWVQSFFKNSSGEKFDIVRFLIDSIGLAWKTITTPIRLVISTVVAFYNGVKTAKRIIDTQINNIKQKWQWLKGQISEIGGNIKEALIKPFRDGWNGLSKYIDKIKNGATDIAKRLDIRNWFGGGAYGYDLEAAANTLTSTNTTTIQTETNSSVDVNLILDFRNVPAGMDEDLLRDGVVSAMTDKAVLSTVLNNPVFQNLDRRAKTSISLKKGRATGV